MSLSSLQLDALAEFAEQLRAADIEYWLFGGWAVDFHTGRVTRPHDDVDVAVWLQDVPRIASLLEETGWTHAPEPDENGGTGYERGGVRLELTFLVRDDDGRVCIALREEPVPWSEDAFGSDVRELRGVRARVMSLAALARGKANARDDPDDAAKDEADAAVLSQLR